MSGSIPVSKRLLSIVLFFMVASILLATVTASSCSPGGYADKVEAISIGTPPLESSALLYVAEERGFFAENGLNVTMKSYDTGAASLTGLLAGEVDIATPAEYALVGRAFQQTNARAIASIDKVQYFFLVGRSDRGVKDVADLKGKKIGVVTKTIAEFYLGRFLQIHGIKPGEVTIVNIDISKSEDVIANGDVDAIVTRPPYVSGIEKKLGTNAVVWPVQSSQALYAVIIGRNDWIADHSETVSRLLSSLDEAEEYIMHNPDQAKDIIKKRLNLDAAHMNTVWSQNQFGLSLDQSLIAAMEDEARWMISNNLTPEKTVPGFEDYIYEDGLKALKPGAVNIIR